jgi:hypothetical protein
MKVLVTVKPGSSQEKIVENILDDNTREVTIWTHARAHDGEANKKVTEVLSDYYKVPKTSITLVRGAASKRKTFEL